MARKIAIKELVFESARQLAANGEEPNTVSVQAHIGGGSFTTVKRYLNEWDAHCMLVSERALEMPVGVTDKGAELTCSLWAMAMREASKQTEAAEQVAAQKISTLQKDQAHAYSELARLEEQEETQYEALERYKADLAQAQAELNQTLIELARLPELQKRLDAAQAETAAARSDTTDKAVAAGRISGETQSLRSQVSELTAALVALKSGPTSSSYPSSEARIGNAP